MAVPSHASRGAVTALTVAFFLIAVHGSLKAPKVNSLRYTVILLLVLWASAFANILISDGIAVVSMYAAVSLAVILLPRRYALLYTGFMMLSMNAFLYHHVFTHYQRFLIMPFLSLGAFTAFVFFMSVLFTREYDARQRNEKLTRELTAAHEQLQRYAKNVELLAQKNERIRIAQDLHDTVGHFLSAAHIQLETAGFHASECGADILENIQKASASSKAASVALRKAVYALRDHSEQAIDSALLRLATDWSTDAMKVSFVVKGESCPLSEELQADLLRAAREALVNTARHADAAECTLCLDYRRADRISLTIRDNGRGSDHVSQGMGLTGIERRLKPWAGTMTIETARGSGFSLNLKIPLPSAG